MKTIDALPLNALIVGCGNIAGKFDESRQATDLPLTHAGALSRDARFKVAACVEPDPHRRKEFMQRWEIPLGVGSIEEAVYLGEKFDVISICSPTACHVHDLEVALGMKPKAIFCEKPVTPSDRETERLVAECRENNILLAVNYSRRFDPDVAKIHKKIQEGYWGELRSVIGSYNKGVLNNGSHMIDLLGLLVGSMEIVKVGKPVHDFFPEDPAVPVWLETANGVPVHLACGHAGDYALFELQLVFSGGVMTMEEGGMFWRERRIKDSATFKGYRVLDDGVRRRGEYPQAMQRALDNIHDSIHQGVQLLSTGDTALITQRLCDAIRQQSRNR